MPTVSVGTYTAKAKTLGTLINPDSSNIQAGVAAYGIDQQTDFAIKAGVNDVYTATIKAGVSVISILPPTSPIAVHIGQGSVLFNWTAPSSNVHHYEIYAGTSYGAAYFMIATNIQDIKYVASGLPMGSSLWFKIRSVHTNGTASTFVQVKLGELQNSTVLMNVRSISGSSIPDGSVFTSYDSSGVVVSFSADGVVSI